MAQRTAISQDLLGKTFQNGRAKSAEGSRMCLRQVQCMSTQTAKETALETEDVHTMNRALTDILAPGAARAFEAARRSIFKPFPNTSLYKPAETTPQAKTVREDVLSHYNPDFDHVKMAAEDPRFAQLGLKDEVLENRLIKENRLVAKGKTVRVSALTGMNIPSGGFKSKKKKKR